MSNEQPLQARRDARESQLKKLFERLERLSPGIDHREDFECYTGWLLDTHSVTLEEAERKLLDVMSQKCTANPLVSDTFFLGVLSTQPTEIEVSPELESVLRCVRVQPILSGTSNHDLSVFLNRIEEERVYVAEHVGNECLADPDFIKEWRKLTAYYLFTLLYLEHDNSLRTKRLVLARSPNESVGSNSIWRWPRKDSVRMAFRCLLHYPKNWGNPAWLERLNREQVLTHIERIEPPCLEHYREAAKKATSSDSPPVEKKWFGWFTSGHRD